jgi:hypothetical protein
MIIDGSYRWTITTILTVAVAVVLLPGAYHTGFPRKYPVKGIGLGLLLVAVGLLLA